MYRVSRTISDLPIDQPWVLPALHLVTCTEGRRRQLRSFLSARVADNPCGALVEEAHAKKQSASDQISSPFRRSLGERTRWLRYLGPLPFVYPAAKEYLLGSLLECEASNPKSWYRAYVVTDFVARVVLLGLSVGLFSSAMHRASSWLPTRWKGVTNRALDISGVATALCLVGIYIAGMSCVSQLLKAGETEEPKEQSRMRQMAQGIYHVVRASPSIISDLAALMAVRQLGRIGRAYLIWRGGVRAYEIYSYLWPAKQGPLPDLEAMSSAEAKSYCTFKEIQEQVREAKTVHDALDALDALEDESSHECVSVRIDRLKDETAFAHFSKDDADSAIQMLTPQTSDFIEAVPPALFAYLRDEGGSAGRLVAAAELTSDERARIGLPEVVLSHLTEEACDALKTLRKGVTYNPIEERDYYHALSQGRKSFWQSCKGASVVPSMLSAPGRGYRDYMPWGPVDALTTKQYKSIRKALP